MTNTQQFASGPLEQGGLTGGLTGVLRRYVGEQADLAALPVEEQAARLPMALAWSIAAAGKSVDELDAEGPFRDTYMAARASMHYLAWEVWCYDVPPLVAAARVYLAAAPEEERQALLAAAEQRLTAPVTERDTGALAVLVIASALTTPGDHGTRGATTSRPSLAAVVALANLGPAEAPGFVLLPTEIPQARECAANPELSPIAAMLQAQATTPAAQAALRRRIDEMFVPVGGTKTERMEIEAVARGEFREAGRGHARTLASMQPEVLRAALISNGRGKSAYAIPSQDPDSPTRTACIVAAWPSEITRLNGELLDRVAAGLRENEARRADPTQKASDAKRMATSRDQKRPPTPSAFLPARESDLPLALRDSGAAEHLRARYARALETYQGIDIRQSTPAPDAPALSR